MSESLYKYTRSEMDKVVDRLSQSRVALHEMRKLVEKTSESYWNQEVPKWFGLTKKKRLYDLCMFDYPIATFLNLTHDGSVWDDHRLDFYNDVQHYISDDCDKYTKSVIVRFHDKDISEALLTNKSLTALKNTLYMADYIDEYGEILTKHLESFDPVSATYSVPLV